MTSTNHLTPDRIAEIRAVAVNNVTVVRGSSDAPGFDACVDAELLELINARIAELEKALSRESEHAKRMSDALIKVRPLGGSELFVKVGERYLADPVYCGFEIERLKQSLHEVTCDYTKLRRSSQALSTTPEDKDNG